MEGLPIVKVLLFSLDRHQLFNLYRVLPLVLHILLVPIINRVIIVSLLEKGSGMQRYKRAATSMTQLIKGSRR